MEYITLEMSRRGFNTLYIQYNPENWVVSFEALDKNWMNIKGFGIREKEGEQKSSGSYQSIGIRTSPLPSYVKMDKNSVDIWD